MKNRMKKVMNQESRIKRKKICRSVTGCLLAASLAVCTAAAAFASEQSEAAAYEPAGFDLAVQTFADDDDSSDYTEITSPASVDAAVKTRKKITVSWSPVLEAASYAIFGRKSGAGSWTLLKKGVSSSKTSFVFTSSSTTLTLYPGETYEFTVVCFDEDGEMSLFGTDAAQTASVTVAPASMVTLVSATNLNYNKNQITWKKYSGADGYRIYRKKAGSSGKYKCIGLVTSAKTTTYTDTTAKVGVTYKYTVCAFWETDGYEGDGSYNKSGLRVNTKLKKPSLKKLTLLSSSNAIRLSWSKTAGATGYIVYRKAAGGSWVRVASISGKANVTYVDRDAEKGVRYQYKVKAYRMRSGTAYYSAYSNVRAKKIAAASANTASKE